VIVHIENARVKNAPFVARGLRWNAPELLGKDFSGGTDADKTNARNKKRTNRNGAAAKTRERKGKNSIHRRLLEKKGSEKIHAKQRYATIYATTKVERKAEFKKQYRDLKEKGNDRLFQ
jgi:hypothetical protein